MRSHSQDLQRAIRFLIGIGAFYTFFWIVLGQIDVRPLQWVAAHGAASMLGVAGIEHRLIAADVPVIKIGGVDARIERMCAGDIEMAVMAAVILATWDRSWRGRLLGVLGGWALILLLNPIRIAIVLAVGAADWSAANVLHDVLFRLSLLVAIFGWYYIWYVLLPRKINYFK